jgi:hypothetical protein
MFHEMIVKIVYYEIPLKESATSIWASGKVGILLNYSTKMKLSEI